MKIKLHDDAYYYYHDFGRSQGYSTKRIDLVGVHSFRNITIKDLNIGVIPLNV